MTDRIRIDVREVPTEDCYPNPWNPNRTTGKIDDAIRESLGAFGQWSPIVVRPHPTEDGKYQILDGEHRLEQAIALDWPTVSVNVVHGLSEDDARKITIIANETRGYSDKTALGVLLSEIQDLMQDEEAFEIGLPFDGAELEALIELAGENWDETGGSGAEDAASGGNNSENPNIVTFTITHPVEGAESLERVLTEKLQEYPESYLKVT